MKLNHLHLTVTSVPEAAHFLKTYFGMKSRRGKWGSDKISEKFTVLFDDDGFVLTLMKAKKDTPVSYPGFFHVGFPQESEQQVDEMYRRLKADGFEVTSPVKAHGYTFYVEAPGGYRIEVLA